MLFPGYENYIARITEVVIVGINYWRHVQQETIILRSITLKTEENGN